MSNVWVGILLGLGSGAWVYAQMYRRTGGNNKSAITVGAAAGFVAFLLAILLLGLFF